MGDRRSSAGTDTTTPAPDPDPDPVVVCGMAMRLPGGATTAASFWELLMAKRCAAGPVPRARFHHAGYYSNSSNSNASNAPPPQPHKATPGTLQLRQAYFLDGDGAATTRFDACHFPFSRREVEAMDPAQRNLLEVTWEALESAGETAARWQGAPVGCYVGSYIEDWSTEMTRDSMHFTPYPAGLFDIMLANRISYAYDFRGPSMTVRTGCSASLVCLHLAEQALKAGECSAAVVAGCNLFLSGVSATKASYEAMGAVLSPAGVCRTFDAAADGYGRGEAVNAVVLKRLSAARRDGNPVRAVVRASAVQHDGRGAGLLTPNARAQAALIRHTYRVAGIADADVAQTAFFECHGTGTVTGDPTEVSAVASVFGDAGVLIGGVKPNVGHSEGAAALTSVIKAVLMLERGIIAPNTNFATPNPNIPWADGRIQVVTEAQPFPADRAKRVSVNSFGIGGTNAHAILEAWDGADEKLPQRAPSSRHHLLLFSASHAKSLEQQRERIAQYISEQQPDLADLAYTLGCRRSRLAFRAFTVAGPAESRGGGDEPSTKQQRSVAFVFNGQGASWPRMGSALVEASPVFRQCIRRLDGALARLPDPPPWTIEGELLKGADESRVLATEFSMPCSTAVQIGIAEVLRSWAVHPAAVTGHSSGEIAAAVAAGALTPDEGIVAAFFRGQTPPALRASGTTREGAMAAVALGPDDVARYLVSDRVVVACVNSHANVTISGDKDDVQATVQRVEADGIRAQLLAVDRANHSPHMDPYGPLYEDAIRPFLRPTTPRVPFYSSVTGQRLDPASTPLDARYWHRSLVQPVRFNDALRSLLHDCAAPVLVEIGASPALRGPMRQILDSLPGSLQASQVATLERGGACDAAMLRAAGALFCANVDFDAAAVTPPGATLADLPPYAWAHDELFQREHRLYRAARDNPFPMHDLLGRQIFEGSALEPTWRKVLLVEELPWLGDHVIRGQVVFPFAAYLAVAEAALRQVRGGELESFTARHVAVSAALHLAPGTAVELHTRLRRLGSDGAYDVLITACSSNDVWTEHCHAVVEAGPTPAPQPRGGIQKRVFARRLPRSRWYKAVEDLGCYYGPAFRGLHDISASPSEQAATARVHPAADATDYLVHPTAVDQCFQLLTIATFHALQRRAQYVFVPSSVDEIVVHRARGPFWTTATGTSAARKELAGATVSYTDDGVEVMSMRGIKGSTIAARTATDELPLFSSACWKPHASFYPFDSIAGATGAQFLAQAMHVLAHTNPQLAVLEMGSGASGATTQALLGVLRPDKEQQLFSRYAYAAVSSDALLQAQESLADVEGLDIGGLGPEAGEPALTLEPSSFDVIISPCDLLLHVARVQGSLRRTAELLRPGGVLITLASPQADESLTQSLVPTLRDAGLALQTSSASQSSIACAPAVFQLPATPVYQSVCIITAPQQQSALVDRFKAELASRSITVHTRTVGDQVPTDDTLVFFMDLAAPHVHNLSEDEFAPFMRLLSEHKPPMVWVTTAASKDPRSSMIYGLARTLRTEHKADLTVVELDAAHNDDDDDAGSPSLARIVQWLPQRRFHDTFGPDFEFALVRDSIQVPRFHWTTPQQELSRCAGRRSCESYARLVPRKPRQVDSLRWVNHPLHGLDPDQIRVEVKASAVSKEDVDALDRTLDTSTLRLGHEGAGVVTQVGSNIKASIRVGDRVMFLSEGAIASHLDVSPARCLTLDDSTPFEVAASLPLAVVTAYLAVVELGRIPRNAIVLLPFVRTNLCLAIVQLLQRSKAEVYLTVDSDDDRTLADSLTGIHHLPKRCILSGDKDHLVSQFKDATRGSRADYAIDLDNQLPQASVHCLAATGVFLDVTDKATPAKIHGSQAYRTVHIGLLASETGLLDRVFEGCNAYLSSESQIRWPPLAKVFDSSACREAFQAAAATAAAGEAADKAILTPPVQNERKDMPMSHTDTGLRFRADAAYLLVGGLGGLGRAVSTWMVENGARQLVYLSRSAAEGPTTTPFFDELRSQGCQVRAVAGSVASRADVQRAVKAANGPIAGVIQMSMVLRDNALNRMTYQEWRECVDPKVTGTWNLHEAVSLQQELDFFLLFSSISGVMGQMGQANYNAANTYLDAVVRHRHRLGLPASVIDIGVMGGIGVVAESANMEAMARAAGYHVLSEQDLVDAMTASILAGSSGSASSASQLVLGMWSDKALADASTHVPWKRDARMSVAHSLARNRRAMQAAAASDANDADDDETGAIVRMARRAPRQLREEAGVAAVCRAMARAIADLFAHQPGGEVLPTALLDDLGLDSLNAVELQAWIAQRFHVDLPMFDLLHAPTLWELAATVAELMYDEFSQPA